MEGLEGPHQHLSLTLKLAFCASMPPLATGKYSPKAPRIVKKRIVKKLFLLKVLNPFLEKREFGWQQ